MSIREITRSMSRAVGAAGGGGPLPSGSYGVVDPRWLRHARITIDGTGAIVADGFSGLSSFGSAVTIFPSPGNLLSDASALEASPRVVRVQDTFPACGCGEELGNGSSLLARAGYHVAWHLGALTVPADGFAGIGTVSGIDTSDIVSIAGQALLAVSDVELETPGGALDLVVTADDGTPTSERIGSRPTGKVILDVYARPNPLGDCEYMMLRLYDAEVRALLGTLVVEGAALIPQGFVSPFALLNRGTGVSSFAVTALEVGFGMAGPPP